MPCHACTLQGQDLSPKQRGFDSVSRQLSMNPPTHPSIQWSGFHSRTPFSPPPPPPTMKTHGDTPSSRHTKGPLPGTHLPSARSQWSAPTLITPTNKHQFRPASPPWNQCLLRPAGALRACEQLSEGEGGRDERPKHIEAKVDTFKKIHLYGRIDTFK